MRAPFHLHPLLIALLIAGAAAAHAQTGLPGSPVPESLTPGSPAPGSLMSGVEFEAYVTGKTLTYAAGGQIYGVEQYLPGRRVRWAFVDDTCRIGQWYAADRQICFVYENDATPQCWTFQLQDGRLRARYISDPPRTDLAEVAQTEKPLQCTGPDVGV
tara:strand:+ start:399 stop:872 length:474 start_codon:yes stop_codon:yes gene_type:complete